MTALDRSLATVFGTCLEVKPHETVLIVTDDERIDLGLKFYRAAMRYARESLLAVMPVLANNGQEPPRAIADMLPGADVIFFVTTRSRARALPACREPPRKCCGGR
jgi:hypothetical protein